MRLIFLLLLLSLHLPLHCAVYGSNALAMPLSVKDDLEGFGYELVADDEGYVLYFDGAEIERRILSPEGYRMIRGDQETEYVLSPEGRILEERSGDLVRRNRYSDSGLLLSSILSDGDEILSFSSYYYDSSGSPIRIDDLDSVMMFNGGSFLFSEGGKDYRIEGNSTVLQEDGKGKITLSDDGFITAEENDGVIRRYDPAGNLIEENNGTAITEYTYDGGLLIREVSRGEDGSVVRNYQDGKLRDIEFYINDELVRKVLYSGDGIHENRYRNGTLYAIIDYDMDGRTIRNIRSF